MRHAKDCVSDARVLRHVAYCHVTAFMVVTLTQGEDIVGAVGKRNTSASVAQRRTSRYALQRSEGAQSRQCAVARTAKAKFASPTLFRPPDGVACGAHLAPVFGANRAALADERHRSHCGACCCSGCAAATSGVAASPRDTATSGLAAPAADDPARRSRRPSPALLRGHRCADSLESRFARFAHVAS